MTGAMQTPLIFRVLAAPAEDLQLTGPNKLILLTLLAFRRSSGGDVVWPSQGQLCDLTGMCNSAVRPSLRRLCELGYVSTLKDTRKSKVWRINADHILKAIRAGEARTERVA